MASLETEYAEENGLKGVGDVTEVVSDKAAAVWAIGIAGGRFVSKQGQCRGNNRWAFKINEPKSEK